MQVLTEKISNIELKVKELALKMERLQQENAALSEQNNELKEQLASQKQAVSKLNTELVHQQQNAVKNGKGDSMNSKKLRKEINQYIKEIDKCIEWLQNA